MKKETNSHVSGSESPDKEYLGKKANLVEGVKCRVIRLGTAKSFGSPTRHKGSPGGTAPVSGFSRPKGEEQGPQKKEGKSAKRSASAG